MALDSFYYQDPAKVIEILEERSCVGCRHELHLVVFGVPYVRCNLKWNHGHRCDRYSEKKGNKCLT
ncbi:MAG: hypothetical protein KGI54_17680 [Pseudomonadota bacterium]|nr:hypothetical protein [Pseudomonadota bacterium]